MTPEPADSTAGATQGNRSLRADARRNRERVLQAADSVFSAEGTQTSTEAVARAAGVGVGTVFRHFPTKDALLRAVFVARLDALAARAGEVADAPDPAAAFYDYFAEVITQAATKHTFVAALSVAGIDRDDEGTVVGIELLDALDLLLGRAQAAGGVRADVTASDVVALLVGTARAVEHAAWDPTTRTRLVSVVSDGLRPPSAVPA